MSLDNAASSDGGRVIYFRDLLEAVKMEAVAFGEIFDTADQSEGMAAFLEKRTAEFRGE